jgi:hypothetical protein
MLRYTSHILLTILLSLSVLTTAGRDFILKEGASLPILCPVAEEAPLGAALELFSRDYQTVLSGQASAGSQLKKSRLVVTTLDTPLALSSGLALDSLAGKREAFLLQVTADGRLWIIGSDAHGAAYGLMQLSRLMGVSPWEWWADATPARRKEFRLKEGYADRQAPSVAYRGIFINDEDWGLCPWSYQNYEPSERKGQIGPRTHERIFELLLRLRANTFWPAMHECSVPFYFTEGNRQVAARYGIYIGTSHCEPMLRNTNGEWRRDGVGEYDFVHNSGNVLNFWRERVKEVAQTPALYTLGMRGVHDGAMNGARTVEEQKAVLTEVIARQREMIGQYVDSCVERVPQVFIPYKEVLDVYHAGLQVPDDVTLMWCDDNYGYIRHFPTAQERVRRGGNGIYYHTSYWGRPHDYLWISGTAPALLCQQMMQAYEAGIQRMWILNVGDIKPLEYPMELFLDMAWDIEAVRREGVAGHQRRFLQREFGERLGSELLPLMRHHQRLAWVRRAEFMGGTRTEERDPIYKVVNDLPWSEEYIRRRLAEYQALADSVEALRALVPAAKQDCYFQLVAYPIQASEAMNRKCLLAQLARHGLADWAGSEAAYDRIDSLTRSYNTPKWQGIMDCQPRRLPVFGRIAHTTVETPLPSPVHPTFEYRLSEDSLVMIPPGESLHLDFEGGPTDSLRVEFGLLPNHPVEGNHLRFAVSLDGGTETEVSYETQGRSEEWKQNILRGEAVRSLTFPAVPQGAHRLMFKALDKGVVLMRVSIL